MLHSPSYRNSPASHTGDGLDHFIRFALITGLTKKATKRARRSMARDRKTIAMAQISPPSTFPPSNGPLVGVGIVGPLPHLAAPSSQAPHVAFSLPETATDPANDNTDTRHPPAWDHTTHIAKLWAANVALAIHGEVCHISLNLSRTEIDKALASPKGFAGYFRESITRSMKRALGYKPKFWIAVDITDSGRLHLHGGMAVRGRNEVHLAYQALRKAGGVWESAAHKDKQAHVGFQDDPDGWLRYSIRARSKVQSIVGARQTHAIANGLIGDARRLYESWRKQLVDMTMGAGGGRFARHIPG